MAWPRFGQNAQLVTPNAGNKAKCFSVTLTTASATQLFTASDNYREILLQNTDSTYYVHCSTFSGFAATSTTPRFLLPPKPTGFTTNGNYNIYCIAEPSAGSTTIEVLGLIEFNVPD